jgi:ribose transport system ATP-binding protein
VAEDAPDEDDLHARRISSDGPPVVSISGVSKSFGAVRAVSTVSLEISPGERLAIIGHNGAGKSTLMNLLIGVQAPDEGAIAVGGRPGAGPIGDVPGAFEAGIRCVFQELSLCSNLSVYENLKLQHRSVRGYGWRRRCRKLMRDALDGIFPGNGIDVDRLVGELPIGERQMVEIARAFVAVDSPVRLVILDEPTSSLDAAAASQLLHHVRSASERGIASIFISHRLKEVLSVVERVVVMRDGRIVADRPARGLGHDELVASMSGGQQARWTPVHSAADGVQAQAERVVVSRPDARHGTLTVRSGEIVGLAGLDGHGQRALLHRIYLRAPRSGETLKVTGELAYVSGDRQREGVFPLWSVTRNITVGFLRSVARFGFLSSGRERAIAAQWQERLDIRTPHVSSPVLSLSGGNQQKVLIARSFASKAETILLDDPTRGVDITTKWDLYRKIRAEAEAGRSFLWYTTEFEELEVCDRLYVFYEGEITDELARTELSEQRILRSSFAKAEAHAG